MILTNGTLIQPTLSMYKAMNSFRCVDMVKLNFVLFMYTYKMPVASSYKNYSCNTQIDQTCEIFLFPLTEGMLHNYTITVS